MSNYSARLGKSFQHILKWNNDHYGRGEHGGQFRPHDLDSLDFTGGDYGSGDDPDKYDRYMTPGRTKPYEPPPLPAPTRVYTKDSKNLVDTFKQLYNDGCEFNGTPEVMAIKWKNLMPDIHPHEFLRAFFGKDDFTNKNMKQLMFQINSAEKRISFASTGDDLSVHGKRVTDYHRSIDVGRGLAHHEKLELDNEAQGGNIVKKLFKSILPLYDKMGITHIQLYANIDRGGYAWGKYGFSYHDDHERVNHQKIVFDQLARLTAPRGDNPALTPEAEREKAQILKVLKSKRLDSIWALTDMKTPELNNIFKDKIMADSDKSTFIKLLTKNSCWAGLMETQKGNASRKRLDQYIG